MKIDRSMNKFISLLMQLDHNNTINRNKWNIGFLKACLIGFIIGSNNFFALNPITL